MESFWVTLITCDPVMWVFHIFRNKLIRINNSNQRVETQGQNGACGRAVSLCGSILVAFSQVPLWAPAWGEGSVPGMLKDAILNTGNPEGPRQRRRWGDGVSKKLPITVCTWKSCQIHNFCLFLKLYIQHHSLFFGGGGVHFCEFWQIHWVL